MSPPHHKISRNTPPPRAPRVLRETKGGRGRPPVAGKKNLDSSNFPHVDAKGLGFSSSAGAAVALALFHAVSDEDPDYTELSRVARLFAGSASRTVVGGFSRLHAGKGYEDTFAEKFADEKE